MLWLFHNTNIIIGTCYPVRSGGGIPAGSDLAGSEVIGNIFPSGADFQGSEVIGNIFPLVADSRYVRRLHFDLLRFKPIFAVWSSFYEFWTIWRNPFNLIIFCGFSFYGFIWSVGCLHQYEQNITQRGRKFSCRPREILPYFCPVPPPVMRDNLSESVRSDLPIA